MTQHTFSSTGGKRHTFSSTVGKRHRHLDAETYEDIYIVGDVHGCIDELCDLWDRLSPTEDDMVVFVGDLVRKGPDSRAVVEFVHHRDNAISVRGNNEDKVIRGSVDGYGDLLGYLEQFPLVVSFDNAVVLHGGLHPEKSLENHTSNELLTMRSPLGNGYEGPFWWEGYDGPPRVFFGHTVLASPLVEKWAVGLDTGCVNGGALSAYDYRREEIASVPARETYQSRPEEEIVSSLNDRPTPNGF